MILQLLYLLVVVQGVLTQSVRLVNGGHPHQGRVEVQFDDVWGTVCHDYWGNNDARVVCRQLGFPHENAIATGSAIFGEGTGPILLDNVNCNGAENNLGECGHLGVGVHNCGHRRDAGVICTNDTISLQVRLVNGVQPHQGRIEVQFNDVWGTVCDDSWDNINARVVCRQLGFPHENAVATISAAFGEGTVPILLDNVFCNGAENNLGECGHLGVGVHNCDHSEDAGVICTNDTVSLQVRLVNGVHPHQGRVEVQFNGVWGTVCDTWWDNNDARVVCRQLGFPYENAVATGSAIFGEGTGQIWLDAVQCNGLENNLGECRHRGVGVNYCGHHQDAGVICTNDTISLQVRLVDGVHPHQGRVEVQFNGAWGTVCDDFWNNTDAKVVCRQLGFDPENATATLNAAFGEGTGQILLDDVQCDGAENNLGECSYRAVGVHDCVHHEDAGVICTNDTVSLQVRLVNEGHPHQGRVEVQFNGVWGTVCDNLWDNNDARVVCRQLGFPHENAIATGSALFGEGTGHILLDFVNCNGAENNLGECSHHGVGVHHCVHGQDAGVICTNDTVSLQVRLVNGGRVEVQFNGIWGTVCDNFWDNNDASVVCRQLGFDPENATATLNAAFGEGTGPIFLDNVGCNGAENNLGECSHWGVGIHNCGHEKDAGVNCTSGVDQGVLTTTQQPVTELTSDNATGTVLTASGTYNTRLKI